MLCDNLIALVDKCSLVRRRQRPLAQAITILAERSKNARHAALDVRLDRRLDKALMVRLSSDVEKAPIGAFVEQLESMLKLVFCFWCFFFFKKKIASAFFRFSFFQKSK